MSMVLVNPGRNRIPQPLFFQHLQSMEPWTILLLPSAFFLQPSALSLRTSSILSARPTSSAARPWPPPTNRGIFHRAGGFSLTFAGNWGILCC